MKIIISSLTELELQFTWNVGDQPQCKNLFKSLDLLSKDTYVQQIVYQNQVHTQIFLLGGGGERLTLRLYVPVICVWF